MYMHPTTVVFRILLQVSYTIAVEYLQLEVETDWITSDNPLIVVKFHTYNP